MRNIHLTLVVCTVDKIKVKISQSFVAFSEYMNFEILHCSLHYIISAPSSSRTEGTLMLLLLNALSRNDAQITCVFTLLRS